MYFNYLGYNFPLIICDCWVYSLWFLAGMAVCDPHTFISFPKFSYFQWQSRIINDSTILLLLTIVMDIFHANLKFIINIWGCKSLTDQSHFYGNELFEIIYCSDGSRMSCSQPELPNQNQNSHAESQASNTVDLGPIVSFSQPLHPDHMLLSSQIQGTPGSSQVMILDIELQCFR